jgi:ATP-binding cassette subfamily F protein 3
VFDDLGTLSPASTQTELRNLLGCFLFRDDDVFKKIGVLSGGERNRYALLRLLLHPANFLLLDEPTNHLDMRAKDVLLNALLDYSGTVVFVSHDRYFIDKLATRVFEVADGGVQVYPGNYEDYLWRKQQRSEGSVAPSLPLRPEARSVPETSLVSGNGAGEDEAADIAKKRLNPLRRKQMEDRCHELEEEIARTETAINQCETGLQHFVSPEETRRLNSELESHKTTLEDLMQEWEDLSQTLDA